MMSNKGCYFIGLCCCSMSVFCIQKHFATLWDFLRFCKIKYLCLMASVTYKLPLREGRILIGNWFLPSNLEMSTRFHSLFLNTPVTYLFVPWVCLSQITFEIFNWLFKEFQLYYPWNKIHPSLFFSFLSSWTALFYVFNCCNKFNIGVGTFKSFCCQLSFYTIILSPKQCLFLLEVRIF